jgi:hypothetical protein
MQVPVIIGPDGKPIPVAIVAVTTVPGAPHLQIVQPIAPAAKPLGRSRDTTVGTSRSSSGP